MKQIVDWINHPESDQYLETSRSSLPRSIWCIGNQTVESNTVTVTDREEIITSLVSLLIQGGDDCAENMGITTNSGICTFGFKFFGATAPQAAAAARTLAETVFLKQFEVTQQPKGIEHRMLVSLSGLFDRLRVLHTPLDTEQSSVTEPRLSERLTHFQDSPFEDWICPIVRNTAISQGVSKIESNWKAVIRYRDILLNELHDLSSQIRVNGQRNYMQAKAEWFEFYRGFSGLSEMATFLRVYIPAFEKEVEQRSSRDHPPCAPASKPSHEECFETFVDRAREVLSAECQALPTGKFYFTAIAIAVALLVFSGYGLLKHFPYGLPHISAFAGALTAFMPWLFGKLKARRISERMADLFDENFAGLRQSFVARLQWVTEKAQITLENQLVALIRGKARFLRRGLSELVGELKHSEVIESKEIGSIDYTLHKWGFDDDQIDSVYDLARGIGSDLRNQALDEGIFADCFNDISRLLGPLRSKIHEYTGTTAMLPETVKDSFMKATNRFTPPLLARLDEYDLQENVTKAFIIPTSYPASWDESLRQEAAPAIPVSIHRLNISAPAVFVTRAGLCEEKAIDSLICAEDPNVD